MTDSKTVAQWVIDHSNTLHKYPIERVANATAQLAQEVLDTHAALLQAQLTIDKLKRERQYYKEASFPFRRAGFRLDD